MNLIHSLKNLIPFRYHLKRKKLKNEVMLANAKLLHSFISFIVTKWSKLINKGNLLFRLEIRFTLLDGAKLI